MMTRCTTPVAHSEACIASHEAGRALMAAEQRLADHLSGQGFRSDRPGRLRATCDRLSRAMLRADRRREHEGCEACRRNIANLDAHEYQRWCETAEVTQ